MGGWACMGFAVNLWKLNVNFLCNENFPRSGDEEEGESIFFL
jgi:hypothetical protein